MLQLFRSDGSIPVLEESVPEPSEDDRLQAIIEQLEDPKVPAFGIVRRIEAEMGRAVQTAVRDETQPSRRRGMALQTKVRALRNLARDVREVEKYRRKEDVLDLDGPKFAFVWGKIWEIFERGLRKALGPGQESIVQSVLRHLRDEFNVEEPEIRKELERMG